jgi:hypothetical protein
LLQIKIDVHILVFNSVIALAFELM